MLCYFKYIRKETIDSKILEKYSYFQEAPFLSEWFEMWDVDGFLKVHGKVGEKWIFGFQGEMICFDKKNAEWIWIGLEMDFGELE